MIFLTSKLHKRFIKRGLDILGAIGGLFLTFPVILIVGALIRIRMGSPIFFQQQRPGLHGKLFALYKFRTMAELQCRKRRLLPDMYRLSQFGHFLRSTSFDELPELFNVIKGDMSIVGPRPLLMKYLDRYTPEQARRHEVKPGLTGWAQVNGRNAITWEEKFKFDVWYVDHQSLWLDLKIIGITVLKVLKREGISQEGEATMEEFNPQITPVRSPGPTGQAQISRIDKG